MVWWHAGPNRVASWRRILLHKTWGDPGSSRLQRCTNGQVNILLLYGTRRNRLMLGRSALNHPQCSAAIPWVACTGNQVLMWRSPTSSLTRSAEFRDSGRLHLSLISHGENGTRISFQMVMNWCRDSATSLFALYILLHGFVPNSTPDSPIATEGDRCSWLLVQTPRRSARPNLPHR
jgi:hypothetical protein